MVLNREDYPHAFGVCSRFLGIPLEEAAKKLNKSRREIENSFKKTIREKESTVFRFTGQEWTDKSNYDLYLTTAFWSTRERLRKLRSIILR